MASSPADAEGAATPRGFALQELVACWNQGYEALTRGDLDTVEALLDVAQDHLSTAGDGNADSPAEQALRSEAMSARGRLEHGMRAGLDGLRDELSRARRGAKALRGYGNATLGIGENLAKSV
jgi:hypothetical protein